MLSRGTGCSVVIVKVEAHVFGRGEARRSSRNHVCSILTNFFPVRYEAGSNWFQGNANRIRIRLTFLAKGPPSGAPTPMATHMITPSEKPIWLQELFIDLYRRDVVKIVANGLEPNANQDFKQFVLGIA